MKNSAVQTAAAQTTLNPLKSRNVQLDGLRGIWAISVVLSHIALLRYYFGLSDTFMIPVLEQWGGYCVTGFFVVSGFLITIHLMKIKSVAGLSPGRKAFIFYVKRTFRVWPLYFTLILLSIYVLPHVSALAFKLPPFIKDARPILDQVKVYYLTLLPEVPLANKIVLPYAEPSWSIGVEEIFYLFIPVYLLFSKCKKAPLIVIAVLLVSIKAVIYEVHPTSSRIYGFIYDFLTYARFECILIGCVAGILFYEGKKLVSQINMGHFLAAVSLVVFLSSAERTYYYMQSLISIAYAVIILYAAQRPVMFLKSRFLAFFGMISFSLYFAHDIAIAFVLNNRYLMNRLEGNDILLYIVCMALSTGLGFVVYKIIEQPFTRLKDRIDPSNRSKQEKASLATQ